ncbi:MAG: PAS domain S-box protein [Syntrophorhabdales bacterium]|jgi:PAS domain S-box-containing protein
MDIKVEVRESEDRFRVAVESSSDAVIIFWGQERSYVNRRFLEMFGYGTEEEALAEEVHSIVHPDDRERVQGYATARQRGEDAPSRYEFRGVRKDGAVIWVEASASRIVTKEGPASLAWLRDITERKQAEEALRESEEKFRILFEKSAYPVLLVDDYTFVDCNDTTLSFIGVLSKDQLIGCHPWDLSPERQPDGRLSIEKAKELMNTTLKQGVNHFEWVRSTLLGEDRWLEVSQTVIPIRGKQVMYTEWRDITDRKKAEESLKESEERYRVAVESSNDGVAIVQADRHVYVNQKFLDIFGYERDEVLGRDHSLSVHPDDLRMVRSYNRKRQRGAPAPNRYDFKGITKDGTRIFVEVSAAPITYRGEPASLVFFRDMTERKALEAQLLHAQKMEAVGTLAAGVAHDFNNILMALMGYANLLQRQMEKDDPARAYADQIIACTGKAAGLTQSLLTFGRKQVMELKPHNVSALVRDVETLLRRLLPEDVRLTLGLAGEVTVMADAGQIAQILINLCANARDAMPNGGELRIETGEARMDGRFIADNGYGKAGLYARISISDTGAGMDSETREKIFEPFFTTKEVGKGTGLGLSIVYGVVKQHQGYIAVESEVGKGTTFRIYLPSVKRKTALSKAPPSSVTGGTETILLADDDADLRKIASEILATAGYDVIEAANGRDAVERFKERAGGIDLLLFDVVMPEKKGHEAYEEIKRLNHNIKVLFMSGYPGQMLPDEGTVIAKPLSPEELLRKVREVLDN